MTEQLTCHNLSYINYDPFAVKVLSKVMLSACTVRYEVTQRSGFTDPRILTLGARWRRVASFMPRKLYCQRKHLKIGSFVGFRVVLDRLDREKTRLPLPGLKAAALTIFRNKWWFVTKLQNPCLTRTMTALKAGWQDASWELGRVPHRHSLSPADHLIFRFFAVISVY